MTATNPPSILVTGGAGYVGAHACKALAKAGYRPVVYDNLSTGHESFVRWGPLVRGDVRNSSLVREVIERFGIEVVLHFAGSASVAESVADPQKYYDNNVAGSLSLLRAMLEAECSKLVFSSTCAIYGKPDRLPISETAPPRPLTAYGASKAMVERILLDYRLLGLRSVSLRYFNAAGADADGEVGELHDPETHLIPRAIMWLLGQTSSFTVFGDDYETADGTAIRDYIHVSDLADAHVSALERLIAGSDGGVFNLGTGRGHSVKEVLAAIGAETGEIMSVVSGPRRAGDPPALVADPSLGGIVLGFCPTHSNLREIVRTAWCWHQRDHSVRRRAANDES